MLASVWSLGFHSVSDGKCRKQKSFYARISMGLKLNQNIILIPKLFKSSLDILRVL